MVLGLVLGFMAGIGVGMIIMGLLASAARGDIEWELVRAQELLRAARGGAELASIKVTY
jgi:hypothetical protein